MPPPSPRQHKHRCWHLSSAAEAPPLVGGRRALPTLRTKTGPAGRAKARSPGAVNDMQTAAPIHGDCAHRMTCRQHAHTMPLQSISLKIPSYTHTHTHSNTHFQGFGNIAAYMPCNCYDQAQTCANKAKAKTDIVMILKVQVH